MPRHLPTLVLLGALAASTTARADPQSLSTNVPVQIEDALPVRLGTLELQGDNRFTRDTHNRRGSDLLTSGLVLKLGPLPGLQVGLSPSYRFGGQSGSNAGYGAVDVLYRFTDNNTYVPALALHGYYAQPYGAGHKSVQYTLRGIATKYLGGSERSPRLHLNLSWYHLTQPSPTQRADQLELAVGYSQLVSDNTAFVVDVVRGAKPERRASQTIVDIGVRHEIGDGWAVSLGVGTGIAQQSPAFRAFFAVQRSFPVF
ncbi:hypothetical protein [Roseomonas mucosa]